MVAWTLARISSNREIRDGFALPGFYIDIILSVCVVSARVAEIPVVRGTNQFSSYIQVGFGVEYQAPLQRLSSCNTTRFYINRTYCGY